MQQLLAGRVNAGAVGAAGIERLLGHQHHTAVGSRVGRAHQVTPGGAQLEVDAGERASAYRGHFRFNGGTPGPVLRFREGDVARITVTNGLADDTTSLHWHGLLVPNIEDGVPVVTTPVIGPGKSRTFEFLIRQHGTYWYHSHTGHQEQRGVYGAIVIEPKTSAVTADHDQVVILSDWTDENPAEVQRTLLRLILIVQGFNVLGLGFFAKGKLPLGKSDDAGDKSSMGKGAEADDKNGKGSSTGDQSEAAKAKAAEAKTDGQASGGPSDKGAGDEGAIDAEFEVKK